MGGLFLVLQKNIYSKPLAVLAAVYIGSGLVAPCGLGSPFINLGFLASFHTQLGKQPLGAARRLAIGLPPLWGSASPPNSALHRDTEPGTPSGAWGTLCHARAVPGGSSAAERSQPPRPRPTCASHLLRGQLSSPSSEVRCFAVKPCYLQHWPGWHGSRCARPGPQCFPEGPAPGAR